MEPVKILGAALLDALATTLKSAPFLSSVAITIVGQIAKAGYEVSPEVAALYLSPLLIGIAGLILEVSGKLKAEGQQEAARIEAASLERRESMANTSREMVASIELKAATANKEAAMARLQSGGK